MDFQHWAVQERKIELTNTLPCRIHVAVGSPQVSFVLCHPNEATLWLDARSSLVCCLSANQPRGFHVLLTVRENLVAFYIHAYHPINDVTGVEAEQPHLVHCKIGNPRNISMIVGYF